MSEKEGLNRLEVFAALLLGLAAIGAAVAGLQSNQWGGKQLDAFAEANAMTTKAAKSYSEGVSAINSDFLVVGTAKRLIIEGVEADTQDQQDRNYKLASYYLTRQLNLDAYKAMGLPMDSFEDDEQPAAGGATTTPAAAPAASPAATAADEEADDEAEGEEEGEEETAAAEPAPAATPAAAEDHDSVSEEEVESELGIMLPEDTLLGVLDVELDDDDSYYDAVLADGAKEFEEADKKFAEGRKANDNGDQFDLAGLFFTVALFFGGLSLVFKDRMSWVMLGLSSFVFAATVIFMMTLNWA